MTNENSSRTSSRRDVLSGAGGIGAAALVSSSLLPAQPAGAAGAAGAADDKAIRPFRVSFPDEALVDLRNLLAQGYVPVMGQDGQTVYLVQAARSFRGGVTITF